MISEERKTSNGCKVAKCVPRRSAGYLPPSSYIAAIDFGTTNCSVAYILPGEMNEQGPILLPFDGTYYRVPTAVLFNTNGAVQSFGTTARRAYRNLEDDERLKCPYFEEIKMNLQHDEFVDRNMKVKAKNNKEYFLVEVIAHILKYLKDELIRALNSSGINLKATDFDWVITVPAIWRARGKQMMREAGYKAGLCSNISCGKLKDTSARQYPQMIEENNQDKLTLVLEPEAAAFYCQNMTAQQRAMHCDAEEPVMSKNYVVVDIGGGTVDISAYQINDHPESHMKILHEPTGGAWGGRKVNFEFKNFLASISGDDDFKKYLTDYSEVRNAKHQADLDQIVHDEFECQKTLFGNNNISENGKITINLKPSYLKVFNDEIEKNIKSTGDHTELMDGELRISYHKIKMFFEPIVNGIIECVTTVLNDVESVQTIYLVGGFGGCKYMYLALKQHFGDMYKFIIPREREFAVVNGAAMMRKNLEFIEARLVDATYGVCVSIPFEEGKHEEKYHVHATSKEQVDTCSNIFATFVERGDVVSSKDVYKMTFPPVRQDQKKMRVQIYSSSEKDVWYTTGKRPSHAIDSGTWSDVSKIGELVLSFQGDGSVGDKEIDVLFDFSTAEISVSACHRSSQTEVKVVLDFLES